MGGAAAMPAWSGVRPAKMFGPAAMQAAVPESYRTSMSEDCLYLNVWTSSVSRNARQPVMVWIYGGGNLTGSPSERFTDGSNLAKLGVTVVAANYRLGAFGYLNDETLGANFGVLDQIAALRWVQENIEAFGGNPSRVLVFGYSARRGQHSHAAAIALAKGLFSRCAITSAGGEDPAATETSNYARSRAGTEKLFEALGTKDINALRAIPRTASSPQRALVRHFNQRSRARRLIWCGCRARRQGGDGNSFPSWSADIPVIFASCQNELGPRRAPREP